MTPINTFMQLLVMCTTQKKSTPYSQVLPFYRIYLENRFISKMCNNLELFLKYRAYNEKLMRQQILRARKYRRTKLLSIQREEAHKNTLVFDITYYPIFTKLRNISSIIHLLLTPDREHSKIVKNISIIVFKKGKFKRNPSDSQNNIFVRAIH